MGVSSLINFLWAWWASREGLLPTGKTKSESGTSPDFFLKLKGAKTLILDEGGLDNEQAKTIAQMIHNILNNVFTMETNMADLYYNWRESMMPGGASEDEETIAELKTKYGDWTWDEDDKDETRKNQTWKTEKEIVAVLHRDRDLFKKFSDWIEDGGTTDSGWNIGALTYLTGVSDSGIQGIYQNLIPTVLAASQVTYFYNEILTERDNALLNDLMKLEPIFFVIPIPIITRKFTEGMDEIFAL